MSRNPATSMIYKVMFTPPTQTHATKNSTLVCCLLFFHPNFTLCAPSITHTPLTLRTKVPSSVPLDQTKRF